MRSRNNYYREAECLPLLAQDGTDRYTTEIIANFLLMLGKKDNSTMRDLDGDSDSKDTTNNDPEGFLKDILFLVSF